MIRKAVPDFSAMIKSCVRGEFSDVLKELRSTPRDCMNRTFLQFYLGQSTKYAHWPSISFIWNRFVVRRDLLVVKPSVLADIAKISMHNGKYGFTETLLKHYNRYYASHTGVRWDGYRYMLLNAHIEMYAKKPNREVNFKKKWHAYISEIDNTLIRYPISVFDFPNMTASLNGINIDRLKKWLLVDCKEGSLNQHSMPMFLNMILLQSHVTPTEKIELFRDFLARSSVDPSQYLQESLQILAHDCSNDAIQDLVRDIQPYRMKLNAKTTRRIAQNKVRELEK
ncbi:Pet122p [Kluyveromyces lactis]|uniref:KLLA0E00947p n=1 Tax=Kluyveromyces lactis (strain ATCC 8585 / CBS 2359 / DSM 70799 / NBRC 1267 / NRRL Y-1140 / WM37) TaxID=284590 RepID=Q6CPZ8_KLULA|nr:uncharacterized protein KLLA0_E00947g [Kluyveromyces lactis]CAG99078.1 KLLA0E00947p [Kluyveromyces lactis]|eukprot:XP_453991.1 uncharacterized protein KLLA0_E00947g [Kluyveromyces lactis]